MQILKSTERYIGAPAEDYRISLNLESSKGIYKSNIRELSINEMDIFNDERDKSNTYLFYGKVEYLKNDLVKPYVELGYISGYSISYGIKVSEVKNGGIVMNDISMFNIGDKIILRKNNKKDIFSKVVHYQTDSDKYLLFIDDLNPSVGDIITPSTIYLDRYYSPITNDFKIFKSGFSVNIFGDSIYQFICNKDVEINQNGFMNYPLTEVIYKTLETDVVGVNGIVFEKIYDSNVYVHKLEEVKSIYSSDSSKYDRISIDLNEMVSTKIQDYFYKKGNIESKIFKEVSIREMGEVIDESYANVLKIPSYTTYFVDGDVFYRLVKDKSDVTINSEYDFPFMNGMHYVFSEIIHIEDDITVKPPTITIIDKVNDEYKSSSLTNANKQRLC